MNISIEHSLEFEETSYRVTFDARVTFCLGGIGSYEFWGATGCDTYEEIDEFEVDLKSMKVYLEGATHLKEAIPINTEFNYYLYEGIKNKLEELEDQDLINTIFELKREQDLSSKIDDWVDRARDQQSEEKV